MLDFIVLGVIPGTQKQVTFYDTLLAASILLLVGMSLHAVRVRGTKKRAGINPVQQQSLQLNSL